MRALEGMADYLKTKGDVNPVNENSTAFTEVYADINPNPIAPSDYFVFDKKGGLLKRIEFQHGIVSEFGLNGVFNEDLISMVLDRLKHFQNSKFKCIENEKAIFHLEQALKVLDERSKRRSDKGILDTHNTDETEGNKND